MKIKILKKEITDGRKITEKKKVNKVLKISDAEC